MDNSASGRHQIMKRTQPNILGQFEPLLSAETLLTQQLERWGGQISLCESSPAEREFTVSVAERSGPAHYKVSIHGDSSCVINEVYYSELEQGLSAVAALHGIRTVSADKGQAVELPDRKSKKSPLKIWRRLSIGTILRTDVAEQRVSPQKSPRQVRRSNSLRLFHGKVTRKFSLKNAGQDSVFRPAASEDSLPVWPELQAQSHPIISGPVRQFVMPSPVEAPFTHATLPRHSKDRSGSLSGGSAGNLPQHTDLDSAMVSAEARREERRPRRQSEHLDFAQHRKLTRSESLVRDQLGGSPTPAPGHRLSKYARSGGRLDSRSPELPAPARPSAHAYAAPHRPVTWRISRRTDEPACYSQTLTCPGDRPQPYALDSRTAARFSVFPIESALLKSGSVQSSRSRESKVQGEEIEAPKQIRSVFTVSVQEL